MRLLIILFCLNIFNISAQKIEKIYFKSANPFALSDIINDLENQNEESKLIDENSFVNTTVEGKPAPKMMVFKPRP